MQQPPADSSIWPYVIDIAKVIGGVIGGGTIITLINRAFGRASEKDVLTTGLRTTILQRLDRLETQNGELIKQIEQMRRQNTGLQVRLAQTETREAWLRQRYHRFVNWVASEPTLPQPPAWVLEDVPRSEHR